MAGVPPLILFARYDNAPENKNPLTDFKKTVEMTSKEAWGEA
jgi:hypothetical protein